MGALYCGQTAKDIIPRIQTKLAKNHKEGNLIIYLQDYHNPNDLEFDRFPPHAIANTYGSETISELIPKAGDVIIRKKRYSGFYGTNLAIVLKENDISVTEVVGVCTSICIMDTVGGLANRDIKTIVPVSCVTDFDQEMHKMALLRMKNLYGCTIVPN